MKKMSSYKRGGAKKKKYQPGGSVSTRATGVGPVQNVYRNIDRVLDDIFPGRQARQDKRAERKAIRIENRDARKKLRQAIRQEKAMNRIAGNRYGHGGSVKWTRNSSRGSGRCM